MGLPFFPLFPSSHPLKRMPFQSCSTTASLAGPSVAQQAHKPRAAAASSHTLLCIWMEMGHSGLYHFMPTVKHREVWEFHCMAAQGSGVVQVCSKTCVLLQNDYWSFRAANNFNLILCICPAAKNVLMSWIWFDWNSGMSTGKSTRTHS